MRLKSFINYLQENNTQIELYIFEKTKHIIL